MPSSLTPDDVYDDDNTTTIMTPAIGSIDDAWRRLIILPFLSSLLEHGGRYVDDADNDVGETLATTKKKKKPKQYHGDE